MNTIKSNTSLDDSPSLSFDLSRRDFVQTLGAGLLLTVIPLPVEGQNARGRQRSGGTILARLHLGQDGAITLLTGKIEMGQGARAELTQAAAEELRVDPEQIRAIMGDTDLTPDDGISAGSRTTPSTVPAVRQGAAAAREALKDFAAKKWGVEKTGLVVQAGKIIHNDSNRSLTYAELARGEDMTKLLDQPISSAVELTPVKEWKVLGTSYPRPNRQDLVTGAHRFPSDWAQPGMLYGKVLRPPSYGAKLASIDLSAVRAMKDTVAVQEGSFVGVAAPTSLRARTALAAAAKTAVWEKSPHPSSDEIYDYLKKRAKPRDRQAGAENAASPAKSLEQTYRAAYVQHAPMETRSALAAWENDRLTVWTSTQNPFGYVGEISAALQVSRDKVHVIVPDFGCGYGGKHTAETAIEAARLARAAQKPVLLKWTRQEEFTWAYFRPAAVIELKASVDEQGAIKTWDYVNINSGGAALDCPYRTGKKNCQFIPSESPLRQGSYRGLAAAANNFARECAMDELAELAGKDPLAFRLANLDHPRLRAVLETAADKFKWKNRKLRDGDVAIGLACGTEKGSYVAACVEVSLVQGKIKVHQVCEAFECGAILNPANLLSQVHGCILMGLGAALWEEMKFSEGRMTNASFGQYRVPRFNDIPELDIHLMDRPDLPSAGGGETPLIAVAPAIANAVFRLTGKRSRNMPITVT